MMVAAENPISIIADAKATSANGSSSRIKRNKKKAIPVESVEVFKQWLVESEAKHLKLLSSVGKGLHVVSTDAIPAGTLLLRETAVASVIGVAVAPDFCASCWSAVLSTGSVNGSGKINGGINGDNHGSKHGSVVCPDCKVTFYCSAACRSADCPVHVIECKAIREHQTEIDQLMADLDIQIDLLRLTLRTLAAKINAPGPYTRILDLPLNRNLIDTTFWKRTLDAAHVLKTFLPEALANITSPEEIREIVIRLTIFHTEISPLIPSSQLNSIGFGIFPLLSPGLALKHSCTPNAHVHVDVNGSYTLRNLKALLPNEEITVALVEIYNGREDRHLDLLKRALKKCNCSRCRKDLDKSSDRFLTGFVCGAECGDVYSPVYETEDERKAREIEEKTQLALETLNLGNAEAPEVSEASETAEPAVVEAEKKSTFEPTSVTGKNETTETIEKALGTEITGEPKEAQERTETMATTPEKEHEKSGYNHPRLYPLGRRIARFVCANPECKHELPMPFYLALEAQMLADYYLPQEFFNNQDLPRAVTTFNLFIETYSATILHPNHTYLFQARIYLLHAATEICETKTALMHCKAILGTLQSAQCLPYFHPDWSDIYKEIAELSYKASLEKEISSAVKKVLFKEAREYIFKAVGGWSVCCGDSHPRVVALKKEPWVKKLGVRN